MSGLRAPEGLTATHRGPQELKLKDEECERLSRVREQLERELEELTASLFEVRWPPGPAGPGLLGAHRLLTTAFFPGSPQDGSRSQHEAGSVRKAAEGGSGQGEPQHLPRPCAPAHPVRPSHGPAGRQGWASRGPESGAAIPPLKFRDLPGPSRGWRTPRSLSCPASFPQDTRTHHNKAGTSVWLCEPGLVAFCLGARLCVYEAGGRPVLARGCPPWEASSLTGMSQRPLTAWGPGGVGCPAPPSWLARPAVASRLGPGLRSAAVSFWPDRHAAGGGDSLEDAGHHVHARLSQP